MQDLSRTVLNKIMIRHKLCVKYNFVAPLIFTYSQNSKNNTYIKQIHSK